MQKSKHSFQDTFNKSVLLVLDLLSLLAALYLAWQLRKSLNVGGALPAGVDLPPAVFMSAGLVWIMTSFLLGLYRMDDLLAPAKSAWLAIISFTLNGLAVYWVSQYTMTVVPRSVYVVYALLGSGFFFLYRRILTTNLLISMQISLKQLAKKAYELDRELSDRKLGVYIVGALGLAWCALVYQAGMGISPDSVNYIQPAAKLRFTGEFDFLPFWPPLFPILIALVNLLIPYPVDAAALLVIACAFTVILLLLVIARRLVPSFSFGLILIILVFGSGFIHTAKMVWSEIPFTMFILAGYYCLLRYVEREKTRYVVLALLFTGFGAFTRYVGLAHLGAISICVLLIAYLKRRPIPWLAILLVNSIVVLGVYSYQLRNKLVYGENWFALWMGPRQSVLGEIPSQLEVLWLTFVQYFGLPLLTLTVLAVLFQVFILFRAKWGGQLVLSASLPLVIGGTHALAMLYSASRYAPVPIDARLLFPSFPFLILATLLGLHGILRFISKSENPTAAFWAPLVLGVLLTVSLAQHIRTVAGETTGILNIESEPRSMFEDGYKASSTAQGMAATFPELIGDEMDMGFYVFIEHELMGPSLLYIGALYADLQVAEVDYQIKSLNQYAVHLRLNNGRELIIDYRYTPYSVDATTLINSVTESVIAGQPFIVITEIESDIHSIEDLISRAYPKVILAQSKESDPYRLMSFEVTDGP